MEEFELGSPDEERNLEESEIFTSKIDTPKTRKLKKEKTI